MRRTLPYLPYDSIYAFGITMWELLMVAPLYDGAGAKEKLPVGRWEVARGVWEKSNMKNANLVLHMP